MLENFPVPNSVFTDDLFRPIFSAAWVGLIMSSLEGIPKSKRIALFTALVLVGVAYFTVKRLEQESD